jgi:hypothetical protein
VTKFKLPELEVELEAAPIVLQLLAWEFEKLSRLWGGIEPIVTRIREKVEGSSGVHEIGRALDFRDEHPKGEFLYSHGIRSKLVEHFNRKYSRRDKKPTLLWHAFHSGNHHFHLQVPARLDTFWHATVPFEIASPGRVDYHEC